MPAKRRSDGIHPSTPLSGPASSYCGAVFGESSDRYNENSQGERSGDLHPPATSPAQAALGRCRSVGTASAGSGSRTTAFGDCISSDGRTDTTLAIDMKTDGTLGCTYFNGDGGTLFLLQEVASADMTWVDQLLLHAQPNVVLLPARAPESLVRHLERLAEPAMEGNGGGPFISRTIRSAEFSFETAIERLVSLDLASWEWPSRTPEPAAQREPGEALDMSVKRMRLGTIVDTDCRLSVGCCGAVIGDLNRRRELSMALGAHNVSSARMFTLSDRMLVNADTLASLQILRSELHPNPQTQSSNTLPGGLKENLSVFGLFKQLAHTPQGKAKLRQVFLQPTVDLTVIEERQRAISLFTLAENEDTVRGIQRSLRKIQDIRRDVERLERGAKSTTFHASADHGLWQTLQRFSIYAATVGEGVSRLSLPGERVESVEKIFTGIQTETLRIVGRLVNKTVDFEQSASRGHAAVAVGIDAQLDRLKHDYDGMGSFLTEVSSKLLTELPDWARGHVRNCIFLPQLGFLTVVQMDGETGAGRYGGQGLQGDTWEKSFSANGAVYYKNRRMRELDAHFGDIYGTIVGREIEILHELASRVLSYQEELVRASDACGDLDSLVALGVGAKRYGWVAPTVTDASNVIHIRNGRHPLQELAVPQYIPNGCYLGGFTDQEEFGGEVEGLRDDPGQYTNVMVLTGPNHSGKSIYLRQVALIVYLAHIGSYVPAESATIGLTDRILTRMTTKESACRSESAFSIDLRQMAFALRSVTRRSLVLVDEFGKGTRAEDGVALMAALIGNIISRGDDGPRVLAATHHHELFEPGVLDMSPNIKLAHMDVQTNAGDEHAEDEPVFLYTLVPGNATTSFGVHCAAINGVGTDVVQRAEGITRLLGSGEDLESACAGLSEDEASQLEKAEAIARRFLAAGLGHLRQSEGEGGNRDGHGKRKELVDLCMECGRQANIGG
ncbi:related to MSH5 - meiosis-specific protein [Cephalotrichum gorgonifer]|uniref:DNA mismatch repair protein MSH5 n=1 Tax=Cephalotrichum gorgonifer TaxID=2041049 RepID=A0AAE8MSE1_9PEZI|nr:related to MSH5 - meiosis-specific protein [Cephalotrichum gorgonifer]